MFKLTTPPLREYCDPWNSPFATRIRKLALGQRRIAYFYAKPDSSTFRYRVYNMIQALEVSSSGSSASYFCYEEFSHLQLILDHIDVLILCRVSYTQEIDDMIWKARSRGVLVLFDVDDLVFDSRFINLLVDSLDQDITNPQVWDSWFAYVTRLGRVLELCSGVIVTNKYLAEKVKAFSNKPVAVVPNFLNREQLDMSDRIFDDKRRSGFARDSVFRIGYFSGTPTHNKDLQVAASALERILDRYSNVKVRLAGFMDVKKHFPRHSERVEFIPFQNFINLQCSIGECEVNIAPLQDNLFTNCKSELKFFEAAVVGTVTIATPTFTLADAIEDARDGFLARAFEWESKLDEVIGTHDSLGELSVRARETCRKRYGWFNQCNVIEAAIEQLNIDVTRGEFPLATGLETADAKT